MLRCVKFKRTMISNVLTAKAISRALLSSYLTRSIKNINSVATTLLQFCNGVVDFVTCLHLSCDVFANDTFWHNIIRIKLDHLYRFATCIIYQYNRQKQHKIPLIVSSQISIPNVSPNLTDAHIPRTINNTTALIQNKMETHCQTGFVTYAKMHYIRLYIDVLF